MGAVGKGIGYVEIPQPSEESSSQALDRESQSQWLSTLDAGVLANGVPLGSFFPQQDGLAEVTADDWDLEQISTETATTQKLSTSGSEYVATNHATGHFGIHNEAEIDVRDNQHAVLGHMDGIIQHGQEQHRVPLQNMDNVQYFGHMMIGEPPQRMKVGDKYINAPLITCTNARVTCGTTAVHRPSQRQILKVPIN